MRRELALFSFKGNRDYVQGTDIFNAVLDWLHEQGFEKIENLDLSFHQLASHGLRAELDTSESPDQKKAAVLDFRAKGIRHHATLHETSSAITTRQPYAEDAMVASATVDLSNQTVSIENPLPDYSAIEYWVTLTKMLHMQMLPQVTGKWLFVRARFPTLQGSPACTRPSVTLVSNYRNMLTRSEVYMDGRKYGDIYFSLLQSDEKRQ